MNNKTITIREAAEKIGVTVTTLRRWDESGKLVAIRPVKGAHRRYLLEDIEKLATDLFSVAKKWAQEREGYEPLENFYCSLSSVFQARLGKMEAELMRAESLRNSFSLITSIVGEIGNNSFDHNLGMWMDIPGIFFAYDANKKIIVLADRGQGILKTLKRVKKDIPDHQNALRIAFTEVITGRAPEHRGNGLKYVRRVIALEKTLRCVFQTGDAKLTLEGGSDKISLEKANTFIPGCIAFIKF